MTPRSPPETPPITPRGYSDILASPKLGQPGLGEFHEMLDEKLQHIRNWAVKEHHQRLEVLQTQNNALRSMLASRSTFMPASPRSGPRAQASEGFNEVGLDHECEDLEVDSDDSQPRQQAPASAVTFHIDNVERWGAIVSLMTLPSTRRKLQSCREFRPWRLHSNWLASKRRKSEQGDSIQKMIDAFEALDDLVGGLVSIEASAVRAVSSQFKSSSQLCGWCSCSLFNATTAFARLVSPLQQMWNFLRLLLVLYDTIMTPVLTFLSDDLDFAKAMSWSSRIFWTLDLAMDLLPVRRGAGNTQHCAPPLRYLKSWFGLDFCIVLSDWLFLLSDSWLRSPGAFLRVVYVRKVLYTRTVRQQRGADYDARSITIYIIEAVLAFAITIHVWACVWYGIGNATNDGWVQEPMLESSRVIHKYFISLGWAASQIHGASRSDSFMSTVELAFSAASIIMGYALFLIFVGRVANAEAIRWFRARQNTERETCVFFCRQNQISPELCSRALRYIRNKGKKHRLIQHIQNEDNFLSLLPTSLRMDMKEQILGRLCMNIDFFKASGFIEKPNLVRKVCDEATSIMPCFADEVIFDEGDICSNAYIVQSGEFHYNQRRDLRGSFNSFGLSELVMTRVVSWSKAGGLYSNDRRKLTKGYPVSEAGIWTEWIHVGMFHAASQATLLRLNVDQVIQTVLEWGGETIIGIACHYGSRFVSQINDGLVQSDVFCYRVSCDGGWRDFSDITSSDRHFAFLSHFKTEAGTEATLMHAELNQMISVRTSHPANNLPSPIFLDSSDLNDLKTLREHVERSQNLILLLTPGVLSRPWCLVEICVALVHGNSIIPVEIQRPGLPSFCYPREEFYQKLRSGALLGVEGMDLLMEEGFDSSTVEAAVRRVFEHIALPFSPHKSHAVRHAELSDIFARCISDEGPEARRTG